MRAGLLPPPLSSSAEGVADGTRTIDIHIMVDGPIVTFIVSNETALSVYMYVYPQLQWWPGTMVKWHGRCRGSARECRRVAATQRFRRVTQ